MLACIVRAWCGSLSAFVSISGDSFGMMFLGYFRQREGGNQQNKRDNCNQ